MQRDWLALGTTSLSVQALLPALHCVSDCQAHLSLPVQTEKTLGMTTILPRERTEREALTSHAEYAMPFVEAAYEFSTRRLKMFEWMKGYRMLVWNIGVLGLGTAVLQWGADFNWVEYVGEVPAMLFVAVSNAGLRWITTTPVGQA